MAVAADPRYSKAWSRLGAARFALGDLKSSVDAYKEAMDVEGGGGSELTRKGYETAKRKLEEQEKAGGTGAPDEPDVDDDAAAATRGAGGGGMPDLGALAGMFGGGQGGGAGGGGGMPDIGAMLNNPMMAQMAQNIMKDPAQLQAMMQNPQVRAMAEKFGLGGGMGGGGGDAGAGAGGAGGQGQGRGGGGGGGMPDLASMMQDPSIQEM